MARSSLFSKPRRGPDFLGIGMQKAGTGFLFECLDRMRGFRMPIRKEFHHFDERSQLHSGSEALLYKIAALIEGRPSDDLDLADYYRRLRVGWLSKRTLRLKGRKVVLDRENLAFLRRLCRYVDENGSDEAYLDVFEPYHDYLTGEITPSYSRVSRERVEQVRQVLPASKIILCARDPVARLWSHFNMRARNKVQRKLGRNLTRDDQPALDRFLCLGNLKTEAVKQKFASRSYATETYRKWADVFGAENMLVIHFDDLTGKTEAVIDKISDFLGGPPQRNKSVPRNKKADSAKVRLDDERRGFLASLLAEEIEEFDRLFTHHEDRV